MRLVLEDGSSYEGENFGASGSVSGEVVFNTGMTGYVQTLTDPSYRGQILLLTYPLIGNYGVPRARALDSIDRPYESGRIQVLGLITQHYVDQYSHHAAARSLSAWLKSEDVPAITHVDTRTLTRKLRANGTMTGWLFPSKMGLERAREQARGVDMHQEVFELVAPEKARRYAGGELEVLLIDVGAKDNIVRSLLERGASVTRIPWHEDICQAAEHVDGVVIGNGPGDPGDLGALTEQVRTLLGKYHKPIFGICLGNQILARAAGGNTFRLPYGHRGVNQPVIDLLTRECFVTSQNHGFAVDNDSLPADWEPWFININDGTNEGIRSRLRPFFGVQFHPEGSPGPRDAEYLFDDFLRLAGATASG